MHGSVSFAKIIENNSDMYQDYVRAVVEEYRNKVAANDLSLYLTTLTPGNVKNACKTVCKQRFRKADERLLSDFFGIAENEKGYLQAIERCDIDKFRPMINFIEGRSKDTHQNNIELLAWLIDFQDRPFNLSRGYQGRNQSGGESDSEVGIDESPPLKNDSESQRSKKSRTKKGIFIATLIVSLLAGTVGYLNLSKARTMAVSRSSSNDSCMYWKNDHYERVSCGEKVQNSKVIALELDLLNNFRRITIPDTITYNSISKVWYIKINGKPEFYTGMGYHPVSMNLQLKPITKYIIDNHILKKTAANDTATGLLPTANRDNVKQSKAPYWGIYGQCQAFTKAETRCSRNAKSGGFCWQHRKKGA